MIHEPFESKIHITGEGFRLINFVSKRWVELAWEGKSVHFLLVWFPVLSVKEADALITEHNAAMVENIDPYVDYTFLVSKMEGSDLVFPTDSLVTKRIF